MVKLLGCTRPGFTAFEYGHKTSMSMRVCCSEFVYLSGAWGIRSSRSMVVSLFRCAFFAIYGSFLLGLCRDTMKLKLHRS